MGKHIIEEEFGKGSGFNLVKIGSNEITSDNSSKVLEFEGNGTVDIDVKDNKVIITTNMPVFKTKGW